MSGSYTLANQAHWNEVASIHAHSRYYDLDGLRAGQVKLSPVERKEVGDVMGKTLLHLQCSFGMSTLSWSLLGAHVMGVDFSEQAINIARSLAYETDIDAKFVCADVYDLPSILLERFDIVFTSYGVLCYLPDLERWANVVVHYVKAGGFFYIVEEHPFVRVFDYLAPEFRMIHPYTTRDPIRVEEEGTYADRTAKLEHPVSYEWNHSLGDIVNALVTAGLTIEFLHEFSTCPWPCFPNVPGGMERDENGLWCWRERSASLPLIFSLKATNKR